MRRQGSGGVIVLVQGIFFFIFFLKFSIVPMSELPTLVPVEDAPFEAHFPAARESIRPDHPAFQSGFLNPLPPDLTFPNPSIPSHTETPGFGGVSPIPASSPQLPGGPGFRSAGGGQPGGPMTPLFAGGVTPFPTTLLIESLQQANVELQVRLQRGAEARTKLERDQSELLSRLEQALKVAVRLKNVEAENGELKENFRKSELELRKFFEQNEKLASQLRETEGILAQLRQKYFSERRRNEEILAEVDRVTTVSDLAKRELDNQIARSSLRDLQVTTMRSLIDEGNVVPGMVGGGLNNRRNPGLDELDFAASNLGSNVGSNLGSNLGSGLPCSGGLHVTSPSQWQTTPSLTVLPMTTLRPMLMSGAWHFSGALFADKSVRLRLTVNVVESPDLARLEFVLTNTSSAIIQQVRLLDCSKPTSAFQFEVQPRQPEWLKPGESVTILAEVKFFGIPTNTPSVCLSYLPSDGIPLNQYLAVPVVAVKLLSPVRPSAEAWLAKWAEFEACEEVGKFATNTTMSQIVTEGELGGNLFHQRGVDPNPRGAVFAGALPAGKHGGVKEVLVRIELAPGQVRLSVRSPLITLSRSVASTVAGIIASASESI